MVARPGCISALARSPGLIAGYLANWGTKSTQTRSGSATRLLVCRNGGLGPEDSMSSGGVLQIEVTERESPVFGGTEFGAVGPYERLHGTVFGELDPAHTLNAGIVNLDRAARNAQGNVEYRSDFRILKPLDLDRGNGCLVYDV